MSLFDKIMITLLILTTLFGLCCCIEGAAKKIVEAIDRAAHTKKPPPYDPEKDFR